MLIKALNLIQANEVTETAYGFSKRVCELQFPSPLSCRKNRLCALEEQTECAANSSCQPGAPR